MSMLIILGILAAVAFYAVGIYNGLIKARQMVKEAWSGIDVQLKRRSDLIPNIVESIKGYAGHEKDTLREVTEMRTRVQAVPEGDIAGRAVAEGLLSQALGKLMAVAEAYPDLKANENMMSLQEELTSTENKIGFARQFYNDQVMTFNNQRQMFPNSLIANTFNFQEEPYFELEDQAQREAPAVQF